MKCLGWIPLKATLLVQNGTLNNSDYVLVEIPMFSKLTYVEEMFDAPSTFVLFDLDK